VQAAGRGIIIIPLAQMRFIKKKRKYWSEYLGWAGSTTKLYYFSEMLKFSIKYKIFRKKYFIFLKRKE
jgi:hypothetical protein